MLDAGGDVVPGEGAKVETEDGGCKREAETEPQ